MTEEGGRKILREAFERAGLTVVEDFPLDVAGRSIRLDGYDAARRVGYEYVTTAAGDRSEITLPVLAELEARMGRGEMAVLLIDEEDTGGEEGLRRGAERFLAELARRGWLA